MAQSRISQLRRRIARILDPNPETAGDPRPEPIKPQSLSNEVTGFVREFDKAFRVERDRISRLDDYEDMDVGDVAAQLDSLTESCLISDDGAQQGFRVTVKKGATNGVKYQNIVNRLVADTGLNGLIRQYIRKTAKRGDTFLEVIFDDLMNVRRVKSVPPKWMKAETDNHGDLKVGTERLPSPDHTGGFIDVPFPYRQVDNQERIVAGWFPWEMLHVKWEDDDELIYSRASFLEPIRRDWKRMRAIEDGMAVARIQRAYMRRIHHVDVTGKSAEDAEEEIKRVKRLMTEKDTSDTRRARWPLGVNTDIYLGRSHRYRGDRYYEDLNKVEIIDPHNTGLENIADVEYFRNKLFTRVPAEVVGAGVVTGDITQQDVAFGKMVLYVQWLMSTRLVIPLCLIALKLKGFSPRPEDFVVEWPTATVRGSWRWSDARFRESMAAANYIELGVISRKRVAQDIYRLDDDEWEAEVDQIGNEQGLPVPGGGSQAQQTRQGNKAA